MMNPFRRSKHAAEMRVFIGLKEVSGYYGSLQSGLHELGVHAAFVDIGFHPFNFITGSTADDGHLVRFIKFSGQKRNQRGGQSRIKQIGWRIAHRLGINALLLDVLLRYDVIILGYDSTFLRFYDYPLFKLFGKRLICLRQGSASRPPFIDGVLVRGVTTEELAEVAARTRRQKRVLSWVERFADVVIADALVGHFYEKPFVSLLSVGLPCGLTEFAPAKPRARTDVLRVLHAPSDLLGKGTRQIREAIEEVRRRGYKIELVELVERQHREVLEEIRDCDFVIDQAFTDFPLAGLATEAAYFGRATLMAGYAADEFDRIYGRDNLPPMLYVRPERLVDGILQLAEDADFRQELGKEARTFIQNEWSPVKVAERFVALIENRAPSTWWIDPHQLRYIHGWGLPEPLLQRALRMFIDNHGIEALQLADKPHLQRLLSQFAGGDRGELENYRKTG